MEKKVNLNWLPLILGCTAFLGAVVLMSSHVLTEERIEMQNQQRILRSLKYILPQHLYNKPLLDSTIDIYLPDQLGHREPQKMYRAFLNDDLSAVAIPVVARNGYSGDIRLLVGVEASGELIAVSIISHQETPGLGDLIESRKSDWLKQFIGRSLDNPKTANWKVKKDTGVFDQTTGATITARAAVDAIKRALLYAREQFE